MANLHLFIGYPEVSSWSLRGWLALKKSGLAFDETVIDYRRRDGKERLRALSPNGLVPLLVHAREGGDLMIWESLSVCEYLAELAPDARLWPDDFAARAMARSVASEMHAGFGAVRRALDMALHERRKAEINAQVRADIARIEAIWTECRGDWGMARGGRWLFGHFTIADAMFAPVATRFRTYDVALGEVASAYQQTIFDDPDFRIWEGMARQHPAPERRFG